MRLLITIIATLATALLAFLYSLPKRMAEDFVIHSLSDRAAKMLHLDELQVESIVFYVWMAAPFLAALGTVFLYHSLYSAYFAPRPQGVILDVNEREMAVSLKEKLLRIIAVISIIVFILGVSGAAYDYRPPAASALPYYGLTRLSNSDLREEAFRVASKISEIQAEYTARAAGIVEPYKKKKAEWTAKNTEYEKALREYENWHATYGYRTSFGILTSPTPLLGTSLFPSTSTTPPEPSRPISPGPEPAVPVVTVDRDWQQKAERVQEETAAVWEEIAQRLGHYPRLFDIPLTYEASDQLSQQASRLRTRGNELH